VDPGRSRIVLVGTPSYRDPRLEDVPAVASNIADLAAILTDPQVGGFDVAHCFIPPAGASVREVGDLLVRAADEAEDLLLFYYSGHGLLGTRDHELYLSLSDTHPDQVPFTALRFAAVRDAWLDSRARSRVVILDSCFSGRAIGDTLAGSQEEVMGQISVSGTYTLTSAPANSTAVILPGERHTAFTERLLHLLRNGSPQAGEMLSLGDIYRSLNSRLRAEGLPVPQQRGTETADLLGLVRNRFQVNIGVQLSAASSSPPPAVAEPEEVMATASLTSSRSAGEAGSVRQADRIGRTRRRAAGARSSVMTINRRVAGVKIPWQTIFNEAAHPLPGVPPMVARRLPRHWRQWIREHPRAWFVSEVIGAGFLTLALVLAPVIALL
jgi:caspase domain-containing protein